MSEQITVSTMVDVYASTTTPARFGGSRLYINTNAQAYVFNGFPVMPPGSQIISAELRIFAGPEVMALGSPPTLQAVRLTSAWDPATLSWTNKPTEGASIATVSAPSDVAQGLWKLNLTAAVQDAINGGAWYGFTLKAAGADANYWWGSQSDKPMQLVVTYASAPSAPVSLWPNDATTPVKTNKPVLSWVAPSLGGTNANLYRVMVQIDDNADFSSPQWSNDILSQSNSLDLNAAGYPGMTSGTTYYWRVRLRNSDGILGPWSDAATFKYVAPGVLTITTASPMADPRPTIAWTFTGATQQAYQVRIVDPGTLEIMYDSGILYGTTMTHQTVSGIWDYIGEKYWVEVYVWDTNSRVAVPGQEAYTYAAKLVEYQPGSTTPPVEIIVEKPDPYWPKHIIRWRHTGTLPDYFAIRRNIGGANGTHTLVADITPSAAAAPEYGTNWYKCEDMHVPGRADVRWYALAVKSGQVSNWNTFADVRTRQETCTVVSIYEPTQRFALVNYDVDPGLSEVSDVAMTMNGSPVLMVQKLNGMMGRVVGRIAHNIGGLSYDQRRAFEWIRKYNRRVVLTWADQSQDCWLYNMEITSIPTANGYTDYEVGFDFISQGGVEY